MLFFFFKNTLVLTVDALRQFSSNDTVTEDVESTRGGEDVRIAVCRPYVVDPYIHGF